MAAGGQTGKMGLEQKAKILSGRIWLKSRPSRDVQPHPRHTNVKTTLEHYIKSVCESVRVAIESSGHLLKSRPGTVEGRPAN